MRFGRTMFVGLVVAGGVAGLGGRGMGRVEAKDRTAPPAGQKSAADSGVATLKVYSRETVVDVVVTGADGQPVLGLKQSDFSVKEDGKEQPIRSFKETGDGKPVAAQALPKLPRGGYSNVGATPVSGPVNIILLDLLNNKKDQMTYAKKATIEYLKTMSPGTEVAVFTLSALRGQKVFLCTWASW